MKEVIELLESNNRALEYAAWNYDEMKLEDLRDSMTESTGVSETCLIQVRENNQVIEDLQENKKLKREIEELENMLQEEKAKNYGLTIENERLNDLTKMKSNIYLRPRK